MRRKTWAPAAAAVLVVATATGGVVVMSSAEQSTPSAPDTPANTEKVATGRLSAMVSQDGTLTYRARPDGSPYAVINQARGVYTQLPENGDTMRARTSVSSTGTCTSSATTPTRTSTSIPATTPSP